MAALSHTVASCPARRKARASEASVFASSSTISSCALVDITPQELMTEVNICGGFAGCGERRGRSMRNVVPWPGVLSTLMLPW